MFRVLWKCFKRPKDSIGDRQTERERERETDRQTDRPTDGRMDGRMDGWTDGQAERQADGQADDSRLRINRTSVDMLDCSDCLAKQSN